MIRLLDAFKEQHGRLQESLFEYNLPGGEVKDLLETTTEITHDVFGAVVDSSICIVFLTIDASNQVRDWAARISLISFGKDMTRLP